MAIPLKLNWVKGKCLGYLELSAGINYIGGDTSFSGDYSTDKSTGITIGFKYCLQYKTGLFLKSGLTSLRSKNLNVQIWPGISIGYCF